MATRKSTLLAGAGLALIAAGPGFAQPASPTSNAPQLDEVIVTAQRRDQNLRRVPIAVTAVSAQVIRDQHIQDPGQLTQIAPSLQRQSINNQVGTTNFSVRGIGTAVYGPQIESSVAVVIDDVVMARPSMGVVRFFDLDRVEVLRGPQGMLFGKNASAGLINIVTARPQLNETQVRAHLSYGNMNSATAGHDANAEVAINVPLSSTSALRASTFFSRQSGFTRNVSNPDEDLGLSEYGGRLKYLWQPNDQWDVYLAGDYAHEDGPAGSVITRRTDAAGGRIQGLDAAAGILASPNNLLVAGNARTGNEFDVGGAQANISYSLENGLKLTNVAAVRYYRDRSDIDLDQLPQSLADINHQGRDYSQFSDELRLTSPSHSRIQYQVGLYYLNLRARYFFTQKFNLAGVLPPPPPGGFARATSQNQVAHNTSYAAFAEGTYGLTDQTRIILGGRYTHDDVDYTNTRTNPGGVTTPAPPGVSSNSDKQGNFSYRVGLQYDLTPDIMTYATYSRGYKGPGFDQVTATLVAPEIPKNIEVGLKSTLFDHRLMLNLAIFHENFDGYQAQVRRPGDATGFFVLNAGSVQSRGVEAEFRAAPVEGLTLSGGVTYNAAKYKAFLGVPCFLGQASGTSGTNVCLPNGTTDVSGNQLAVAPKWSATLSAAYERPISSGMRGFVQADYAFRSGYNYQPSKDPGTQLGSLGTLGVSVGLEAEDKRWRLAFFGRNLTDERTPTYVFREPLSGIYGDAARGGNIWQQFDQSSFRTIGVSLDLAY